MFECGALVVRLVQEYRSFLISLEDELSSKEELALAAATSQAGVGCAQRAGDLSEVGAIDIRSWISEVRSIRYADRVRLKFEVKASVVLKVR